MEGPHNDKDASTFVLAVSSFFILHNNPIHSFGFVYLTIKQACIISALIIGLTNHREDDAEGDNASPMTVAQSFQASTTAYQPPTQATPRIAGSRLSLLATAENGRCGGATPTRRRAFRLNAVHEVDEDVALDASLVDEGLGVTVRPTTRGRSSGTSVSPESRGDVRRGGDVMT